MQFPGPPISLNPALGGSGGSVIFAGLAYDPLIYLSGAGKLVPDLATSWKYTDTKNKVFELTLRKGVKFADGSTMDAKAVVASMKYFLKAGGGLVHNQGAIGSITAVNPTTVRINYKQSNPAAARLMTQYYGIGFIIGPKGLANPKSLLTTMDGTGAYTYDHQASVSGSKYVYKRNPNYWNPKAQMFDQVNVDIIGNPNAVLAAIKTGQVDVAGGDPSTAESAKQAGLQVLKAPFFNWGLQLLDRNGTLSKPLADVRVRRAIAYAFDRKSMAKALVGDYGQPSNQIEMQGTDGYDSNIGYTYDLSKAKHLMAEAGYANGFSLTILTEPTLDPNDTRAQAIASALSKIGIKAKLHVAQNVPTLIKEALTKKYPALFWTGGGNNMFLTAQAYAPGSLTNPFGVTDTQLSKIFSQAFAASGAARTKLYQKASERFQDLAWFAPTFVADVITYASSKVENVTSSVINPNPLPEAPIASLAWRKK